MTAQIHDVGLAAAHATMMRLRSSDESRFGVPGARDKGKARAPSEKAEEQLSKKIKPARPPFRPQGASSRRPFSKGLRPGMAEAMALGKPVIGTDFLGNRDFLTQETGFPVPHALRR